MTVAFLWWSSWTFSHWLAVRCASTRAISGPCGTSAWTFLGEPYGTSPLPSSHNYLPHLLTFCTVLRFVTLLSMIHIFHCEDVRQFIYLSVLHLLLSCLPGYVYWFTIVDNFYRCRSHPTAVWWGLLCTYLLCMAGWKYILVDHGSVLMTLW